MSSTDVIVNTKYKYVDNDINRILGIRIGSENLTECGIFPIAPIAEQENKLVTFLNGEKVFHGQYPNRTLLIPYLTGYHKDGHWVGVLVRFENNIAKSVEYYDSLGKIMITQLAQDLKKVYGDNIKLIERKDVIQQDDSASCGPCMIENLINAAKNDFSKLSTPYEIRKDHIELMIKHEPNGNFYERQKNNDSLISRSRDIDGTKEIDDLSVSISNIFYDDAFFPRCEYKARFEGTSTFDMREPDYWGTYFRSTSRGGNCDRIAQLVKSHKTYENRNINKSYGEENKTIPASKAGTIKSPWIHDKYKKIFNGERGISKKTSKKNDPFLYDELLQYKMLICNIVVDEFSKIEIKDRKIDVYCVNDYPCVMVQVHDLNKIKGETDSLYQIVIAYFIGITNYEAIFIHVPIELVNRASFGHNNPSVTVTGNSFRINIGLVPEIYAKKVLVKSLQLFNDEFLVPFLNKDSKLRLGMSQIELGMHKKDIIQYNWTKNKIKIKQKERQEVEEWNSDDNLFDVLCKVGDSSGRKVALQIVRKNKFIDLLIDYVHDEIINGTKQWDTPLTKVLRKLRYEESVSFDDTDHNYNQRYQFPSGEENEAIEKDKKFWETMEYILSVFEVDIESLSDAIKNKKIKNLYSILEKANLEFIRNSGGQQAEDGYGSSSDCEVTIDETTFNSRKIITATGMRAINVAQFLSIYEARTLKVDTTYMYYETSDVVKRLVNDIYETLNLESSVTSSGKVRYIDLNHCAAKGPNSKVDLKYIETELDEEKVIVLDYTSATSERISEAVQLFIKKVPVLLLVSSGVKNEQIGADTNPYGTIRIIAKDVNVLDRLYFVLIVSLAEKEKLPKELHNIRKAYKAAGAVVTSAAIYANSKDRKYNYNPKRDSNIEDYKMKAPNFPDNIKRIVNLFCGDYADELKNLKAHGRNAVEILTWESEKVKFLGSDGVTRVITKFEDDTDIFYQIEELYDTNAELTRKIVNELNNCEYDDIQYGFGELADKYCSRIPMWEIKECDDWELTSNTSIIDDILGEEEWDEDAFRCGFAIAKMHGDIDSGVSTPRSSISDYENIGIGNLILSESSSDDNNSTSGSDEEMEN